MKDGLDLAIRFSYRVNHLRYCGPKEAEEAFTAYLERKEHPQHVKECLRRFEGLLPYLDAIAKKHHKDLFDYEVIEAYWVGNELLEGWTTKELCGILDALEKRGLPPSHVKEKKKQLIEGMFPHHAWNVFFVGVGKITGAVPTTLMNMNKCRPSWGTVLEVKEDTLKVRMNEVIFQNKLFLLGKETENDASYLPSMLKEVKPGDAVALHWGFAGLILSKEQQEQLEQYTRRLLSILNCVQRNQEAEEAVASR